MGANRSRRRDGLTGETLTARYPEASSTSGPQILGLLVLIYLTSVRLARPISGKSGHCSPRRGGPQPG